MLKKLFYISLVISIGLIVASVILVPLADRSLEAVEQQLWDDYYQEGSVVNSIPFTPGQKVIIQADDIGIHLAHSNNQTLWAEYSILGHQDTQVTFIREGTKDIALQVTVYHKKTRDLTDITQYRGDLTVYIPDGMEYEVTGTPYGVYEWDSCYDRQHSHYGGCFSDPYWEEQEPTLRCHHRSERDYRDFQQDIFQLMEEYPYKYTMEDTGEQVIFHIEQEHFDLWQDLYYVSIGDGYLTIDGEDVFINGYYYHIPHEYITIHEDSAAIGSCLFTYQ